MPNTLASNPEDGLWESLPDHILLSVLQFLQARDLLNATQVCKQWNRVGKDEFLWKDVFYTRWSIDREIAMAPGRTSWLCEYKRLHYHIPYYETEVLREHRDQVLHVSFSHNGQYFATSSKDGFVKVWTTSYPSSVKYYEDMKAYTWKYTQFTQFNRSDTLLLVSGVHFGSHSTSGEIAVFNIQDGFQLQCRVQNKPYDIFGTWYNDSHLLSGNLHWLGNFSSCSILWLNKASQELDSEWQNVVMKLFKFLNTNASSIRTIFVSNCPTEDTGIQTNATQTLALQGSTESQSNEPETMSNNATSNAEQEAVSNSPNGTSDSSESDIKDENGKTVYRRKRKVCEAQLSRQSSKAKSSKDVKRICSDLDNDDDEGLIDSDSNEQNSVSENLLLEETSSTSKSTSNLAERESSVELLSSETGELQLGESSKPNQDNSADDICKTLAEKIFEHHHHQKSDKDENAEGADWFQEDTPAFKTVCETTSCVSESERDKFLIFTTGSLTYTPHQIGIKRIKHGDAIGRLDKLSRERWLREQRLKLMHQLQVEKSLLKAKQQKVNPDDPEAEAEEQEMNNPVEEGNVSGGEDQNGDVGEDEDGFNRMDPVDHLIEMNGHIIGMQLSPDQRYLYVNTRAWPQNYQIEDPLEPPPIAQQIEIHVVDLLTIQDIGVMHCAHKAYTPNDECFFIFLDVCNEYVASGAEDMFGYLWDRHYRALLNKYPHNDVVNSVAFHPKDSETMVTVSDDFKVKVWRSKNRCRELGIDTSELQCYDKVKETGCMTSLTSSTSTASPNVEVMNIVEDPEMGVQND